MASTVGETTRNTLTYEFFLLDKKINDLRQIKIAKSFAALKETERIH